MAGPRSDELSQRYSRLVALPKRYSCVPDVEDQMLDSRTAALVSNSPTEIGLGRSLEPSPDRIFDQITEWICADLAELAPSRHRLSDWLADRLGADHKRLDDIVLLFSELLANAIAGSPAEGEIRFSYASDCQGIKLRVVNQNDAEVPLPLGVMPESDADRGRGLALVEEFADRTERKTSGRQVDISARFYL